jgi:hypothetical protein
VEKLYQKKKRRKRKQTKHNQLSFLTTKLLNDYSKFSTFSTPPLSIGVPFFLVVAVTHLPLYVSMAGIAPTVSPHFSDFTKNGVLLC